MNTRANLWATTASVASAAASSACCWLPLILVGFGVSAAGIGSFFEKYRIEFIVAAALLLGLGFYLNYFRRTPCKAGSSCEAPSPRLRRFNRGMLWLATALVLAFAFFPSYVGSLARASQRSERAGIIELTVDGMTCESCTIGVRHALERVPGVVGADVDYNSKRATVRLATPRPEVALLTAAVAAAGYQAAVAATRHSATPMPSPSAESELSDLRARIQGRWHGTIGDAPDSTTVFVDIDTLSGGHWIAEADVPAQDLLEYPLGIEVRGDTVFFYLNPSKAAGPSLSAIVPAPGAVMRGTFTQGGKDSPAELTRIGPPQISETLRALSSTSSNALDVTLVSDDARELREQFNAHADQVRLLMLLSPT